MKKTIIACLILSLYACGSKLPPETQYFVLTPTASTTSTSVIDAKISVVLKSLRLAEFLDQPGIVLQTDTHQIKVAHYHRWAEPLKRNMHRYMMKTLNSKLQGHIVQNDINLNEIATQQSLQIIVNQFNGTKEGAAIFSGNWILSDVKTKSMLKNKSFHYEVALVDDGYAELVNQLAILLEQLCSEIAQSI